MSQIVQAEIVGIREAENTNHFQGVTYNSTFYSILVFYDDGSRDLIEGNSDDIRHYLKYVKPRNDLERIETLLSMHERKIKTMVQEEVLKFFESIHPIPCVIDKDEYEATRILENSGFKIEMLYNYPPNIPAGVVKSCYRKKDTYMSVILDVQHVLPDTSNLSLDEAILVLEENGFVISINEELRIKDTNKPHFTISRDENTMNVTISVYNYIPSIEGLTLEEAKNILLKNNITICRIENIPSDDTPSGIIVKTEISDNNGVVLFVSTGKELYVCKNLVCSVSRLKDSSSCSIHGSAKYNIKHNKIELDMNVIQNVTHRHMFIEDSTECYVDGNMVGYSFPYGKHISNCSIDSINNTINLVLYIDLNKKQANNINQFPSKACIYIKTIYTAITKKEDDMLLDLEFNWQ